VDVRIVNFPETKVAAIEHRGPQHLEYESIQKLIEWRRANRMSPDRHRTYGVYHSDPRTTPPNEYRFDICLAVPREIPPNPQGVVNKRIPGGRCAVARHVGSRENVTAGLYLYETWLPGSGETLRDFPVFFHYVNVGPGVEPRDMITDVYLPIQ